MNDLNWTLRSLPGPLKTLVFWFMIVLTVGVTVGIGYVVFTTRLTPAATITHYQGDATPDDLGMPQQYAKPFTEMLLTTHTHVISFGLIYLIVGALFYLNSTLPSGWTRLLMIEPLVATLTTFGSIWGVRFLGNGWVWVLLPSGILMYTSYYIMAGIIFWELLVKDHE